MTLKDKARLNRQIAVKSLRAPRMLTASAQVDRVLPALMSKAQELGNARNYRQPIVHNIFMAA